MAFFIDFFFKRWTCIGHAFDLAESPHQFFIQIRPLISEKGTQKQNRNQIQRIPVSTASHYSKFDETKFITNKVK